jgi:hypothetical protein
MTSRLDLIATAVHANLVTTGVTWHTGAQHLATQGAPPLVVWVASDDVKHMAGGEQTEGEIAGVYVRQILTRQIAITVHVWAATYDAAELLVLDLIAAAHEALGTSCHWAGEKWPKQIKHERLKRGEPVLLRMVVDTPALDRAGVETTITSVETFPLEFVDDLDQVELDAILAQASSASSDLTVTAP